MASSPHPILAEPCPSPHRQPSSLNSHHHLLSNTPLTPGPAISPTKHSTNDPNRKLLQHTPPNPPNPVMENLHTALLGAVNNPQTTICDPHVHFRDSQHFHTAEGPLDSAPTLPSLPRCLNLAQGFLHPRVTGWQV